MNSKSISQNPAGYITCAIFYMIIIFSIIGLPKKNTNDNINPVIKGPRSYKTNVAALNNLNDDTDYRITKKESSFYPIIIKAADKHDVDPALIMAIIMAESRYNPKATSKKGAMGLMQIMPLTASAFSSEDMYDPVHNINVGVEYFKHLLNRFEGNVELALAAYNAGPRKVSEYQGVPPYKATMYYIKKVFEYYSYYLNA